MGITLSNIRINNFRSLESIDLHLRKTNVLIGQNNCGKSNFLKAIDIALGSNSEISEEDIYISADERLANDKSATIDILIKPINGENVFQKGFNEFWTGVFTDSWITTNETNGDFVGIRTIIKFDTRRSDYILVRYPIVEWGTALANATVGKKRTFGNDMVNYIRSFYMDAHRDAVADLRNKKSYFGKATSQNDLSDELIIELEGQLNLINDEIINNIPALQQTTERLASIGKTIGAPSSSVEIEPLTRKISDLHKGMDVVYKDGSSAKFSISQHGMGTRSWISFLTLGAYVDWHSANVKADDHEAENYVMLTMEEPEAHLHPQAQRQLYSQILNFNGQKVISTHSPSILAQADLRDIIHFEKTSGKTKAVRFNYESYEDEELKKIQREVINTRGELLFSNAIILCEGITEEQALPLYFEEYFGIEAIACGINIIGIGGQNYKTFLNLIKYFKMTWFIFSDGEASTVRTVEKAIKIMPDTEIEKSEKVVILDNGEDYENHLLEAGYGHVMIDAINTCEGNTNFFTNYMATRNHTSAGRHKTDKPLCKTCGQAIFEDTIRNYNSDGGSNQAIYDCCTGKKDKAKYATYIAMKIIEQEDVKKRIPPKVKVLFSVLAEVLKLEVKEEHIED